MCMDKNLNDFLDHLTEEDNRRLLELLGYDPDNVSMFDFIHRCLLCDELAEEVGPGTYSCTKCRFTWEVIGD